MKKFKLFILLGILLFSINSFSQSRISPGQKWNEQSSKYNWGAGTMVYYSDSLFFYDGTAWHFIPLVSEWNARFDTLTYYLQLTDFLDSLNNHLRDTVHAVNQDSVVSDSVYGTKVVAGNIEIQHDYSGTDSIYLLKAINNNDDTQQSGLVNFDDSHPTYPNELHIVNNNDAAIRLKPDNKDGISIWRDSIIIDSTVRINAKLGGLIVGDQAYSPRLYTGRTDSYEELTIQPIGGNKPGSMLLLPSGSTSRAHYLIGNENDANNFGFLEFELSGLQGFIDNRYKGTGSALQPTSFSIWNFNQGIRLLDSVLICGAYPWTGNEPEDIAPTVLFQVKGDSCGEGRPATGFSEIASFQKNNTNTTAATVTIIGGSATTAALAFGDKDDVNPGLIKYNNSDNSMIFSTNDDTAFMINSSGQIGINKYSSIAANLHIKSTGTGTDQFRVDMSSGDGYIRIREDGSNFPKMYFYNSAGANAILFQSEGNSYFNTGGNLGIGTITPTQELDVNGDVNISGDTTIFGSSSPDTAVHTTNKITHTDTIQAPAFKADNLFKGDTTINDLIEAHADTSFFNYTTNKITSKIDTLIVPQVYQSDTIYISIPANEWIGSSPSTSAFAVSYNTSGAQGDNETPSAAVMLPNGYTIVSAIVYGTASNTWQLFRVDNDDYSTTSIIATANTNTFDNTIEQVVNNSLYFYSLYIPDLDNNEWIYGSLIKLVKK